MKKLDKTTMYVLCGIVISFLFPFYRKASFFNGDSILSTGVGRLWFLCIIIDIFLFYSKTGKAKLSMLPSLVLVGSVWVSGINALLTLKDMSIGLGGVLLMGTSMCLLFCSAFCTFQDRGDLVFSIPIRVRQSSEEQLNSDVKPLKKKQTEVDMADDVETTRSEFGNYESNVKAKPMIKAKKSGDSKPVGTKGKNPIGRPKQSSGVDKKPVGDNAKPVVDKKPVNRPKPMVRPTTSTEERSMVSTPKAIKPMKRPMVSKEDESVSKIMPVLNKQKQMNESGVSVKPKSTPKMKPMLSKPSQVQKSPEKRTQQPMGVPKKPVSSVPMKQPVPMARPVMKKPSSVSEQPPKKSIFKRPEVSVEKTSGVSDSNTKPMGVPKKPVTRQMVGSTQKPVQKMMVVKPKAELVKPVQPEIDYSGFTDDDFDDDF